MPWEIAENATMSSEREIKSKMKNGNLKGAESAGAEY